MSSSTPLSVAVIGAGMAGTTHANAWRQVGTVFELGLPEARVLDLGLFRADACRPAARAPASFDEAFG